jgi:hypothetical protein
MATEESNDGMPSTDQQSSLSLRSLGIVRRPLLFGLTVGGIPLGLVTAIWWDRIMGSSNDATIGMLLLFTVSVATVGTVLGGSNHWKTLLYRAFLISIAMCAPIPLVVDFFVLSTRNYEVFYVVNFPFHVALCGVWSIEVTVASGLLALLYVRYQSWHGHD